MNATIELMVTIPVAPCAKPRMTRSDVWKQRPAVVKYRDFKDALRREVRGTLEPRFTVVFLVAMPKSWSEQKRAAYEGKPHQQKPDVDNFLKGLMDALCTEDQHIYDAHPLKFWAREGSIILKEHQGEITWPNLSLT